MHIFASNYKFNHLQLIGKYFIENTGSNHYIFDEKLQYVCILDIKQYSLNPGLITRQFASLKSLVAIIYNVLKLYFVFSRFGNGSKTQCIYTTHFVVSWMDEVVVVVGRLQKHEKFTEYRRRIKNRKFEQKQWSELSL